MWPEWSMTVPGAGGPAGLIPRWRGAAGCHGWNAGQWRCCRGGVLIGRSTPGGDTVRVLAPGRTSTSSARASILPADLWGRGIYGCPACHGRSCSPRAGDGSARTGTFAAPERMCSVKAPGTRWQHSFVGGNGWFLPSSECQPLQQGAETVAWFDACAATWDTAGTRITSWRPGSRPRRSLDRLRLERRARR
jgi:hypothetical protein